MKQLIKLIVNNQSKKRDYRIVNEGEESTVYLYDVIDDYYGVSSEKFAKDLSAITAKTIHLRINSPGGDVFAARAMATTIKQHPANVIAHVDGLAASAATYIALSANEVRMSDGSLFMIHNAWTIAFGNASELRDTAGLLDKIDGTIVNDYIKKTGATESQVKDWMSAETWFTAQEALDNGFIDSITDDTKPSNEWNLDCYNKAPKNSNSQPNCSCSSIKNGERLASVLNDRIDELEDEETNRTEIIENMASEAGISSGTVNQILNGDINCPPIDRLEGFARALSVPIDSLTSAAESDGCDYTQDKIDLKAKQHRATQERRLSLLEKIA